MISRLVVKATLVGVAASLAVAAPAYAADAPTLDPQTSVVLGYSLVTLKGTADPGTTVQLWESAFYYDDLYEAEVFDSGPTSAVADSSGKWSLKRYMDSGFYFQVRTGSLHSEKRKFSITQLPTLSNVAPAGNNTVTATILANPAQPDLLAELQKKINGKWTKVGEAYTSPTVNGVGGGVAQINATGVSGGAGLFRAYVNGDPLNAVLPGAGTAEVGVTVPGPVTDPTPPPTTTPKPPATPKPTIPAYGAIKFTRIQYDSPGVDSGSNGSLNTEWVRMTNTTKSAINLRDWTLRDGGNHVYKFNGNVTIGAGQSLFVLSGKGTNSATKRYWGRAGKVGYIWNNGSEFAFLRAPNGKQIAYCHWPSLGKGFTTC